NNTMKAQTSLFHRNSFENPKMVLDLVGSRKRAASSFGGKVWQIGLPPTFLLLALIRLLTHHKGSNIDKSLQFWIDLRPIRRHLVPHKVSNVSQHSNWHAQSFDQALAFKDAMNHAQGYSSHSLTQFVTLFIGLAAEPSSVRSCPNCLLKEASERRQILS